MTKYQKYAEYKDSQVEWLGEIPSHWEVSKLRYLFDFSKGLTITKENLQDEGIPCVNYGEVHSKFGFEVDSQKHSLKCVNENYLKTSENVLLNKGDFVFADTSEDLKGSGNFTHLVSNEPIFAGYHTVIARPHNAQASRFYAYLFESKEFRSQIQLAVKGVKVFSITQAMLRSADAWLPSLSEQAQIAHFLDHETAKIDRLIAKQEQLIALLQEKRQAVISHAVTKGLNPDATMKDSGVGWLGQVPEHWTVLNLRWKINIASGDGISANEVENEPISELAKVIPVIGGNGVMGFTNKINTSYALAIGRVGALCGNVHLIDYESWITDNALKINKWNDFDSAYLALLLKAARLNDMANKSAQPLITGEQVKGLRVVIPPVKEQRCIVSKVQNMFSTFDDLIMKAQSAIQLMQERRTALISAAVTGKIDVRDWQATPDAMVS